MLAPFRVKSFRFQWPSDLLTSWAFEMETLILGWYVLVETGSVTMLTLFGALQFVGTLLSPLIGMLGDRLGHRNVLCCMRAIYALLAAVAGGGNAAHEPADRAGNLRTDHARRLRRGNSRRPAF